MKTVKMKINLGKFYDVRQGYPIRYDDMTPYFIRALITATDDDDFNTSEYLTFAHSQEMADYCKAIKLSYKVVETLTYEVNND